MNEAVKADAREYGRHVKQGGWRLGLLVARSVEKGAGQGARRPLPTGPQKLKVSIAAFSREASDGRDRIAAHFDAWEKAAETGIVPTPEKLKPGVDPRIDWDMLPEWGEFYTPVGGGYNGGNDRQPSASEVQRVITKADPATLTEAMGDPTTRMRAEGAASRSREISRSEARSERRAGGKRAPSETAGALLVKLGTLMSDGNAWAGRLSDLWEQILRECSDEQVDAARGRVATGSFAIAKVLADIQGEGIDAALAEILRGGE